MLTVRVGALMDEAIPCANQVDTVILQGKTYVIYFDVIIMSEQKEKKQTT